MDVAELGLTESEMRILRRLYESADETVSVRDLLDAAGSRGKRKTCAVHICRIRKSIEEEDWPLWIDTIHSQGYRWVWHCIPEPVHWPDEVAA